MSQKIEFDSAQGKLTFAVEGETVKADILPKGATQPISMTFPLKDVKKKLMSLVAPSFLGGR
ncbi:MAG: hypothetical protein EBT03_09660 [Betaproteobacteria bacterium]|nr:hypothetical protein [Betaproteobacteria bacterium]NCA16902.1 hypothetical protein [Betaproteobacteria bacterium]